LESATDRDATTRIADRLEITELVHSYARHFDLNEPDQVAELFSIDARVDYGPEFPPIEGRDHIADRIGVGLREIFAATSHHISNASIRFEGSDHARGEFYVYAWHRYVDGSEGYLWGRYQNTFERTENGWRISQLVLQAAGTNGFHRQSMHPIGRQP
jgi:hypothetical protein